MRLGVSILTPELDEFVRRELSALVAEIVALTDPLDAIETGVDIWFLEWPHGRDVVALIERLKKYAKKTTRPPYVALLHGTERTSLVSLLTDLGAADCLILPTGEGELQEEVEELVIRPRRTVSENTGFERIAGKYLVGGDPAFLRILNPVRLAAKSDATVLIVGENGTGKEMVARTIHEASTRAREPFVAVNVAALPANLIESELFGHEKGAFTDAHATRKGWFELAGSGTLLLDEIGELEPTMQVKLLRVLQEREVSRLGGTQAVKVKARIVAATNANLAEKMENGGFRRDLFERLNQIRIDLPPLRKRKQDIPILSRFFVQKHCDGRPIKVSSSVAQRLSEHDYPGNVRELENVIIKALHVCEGHLLLPLHLPEEFRTQRQTSHLAMGPSNNQLHIDIPNGLSYEHQRTVAIAKVDEYIHSGILERHGGNVSAACREIGIDRKTFVLRLNALKNLGSNQPVGE